MVKFVRVEYTGKVKNTDEVFDTTQKDVAEKSGMSIKGRHFGAIPMIVGDNKLIKGFEAALENMKSGEEKTIIIEPEEGYGERRPELIQLVPISVFKKSGQKPYPGMVVVFENQMPAKVQSVSGGRVRLDFNHELAGKTLEFWIKLIEEINKDEDKIKALFELTFSGASPEKLKVEIKDKDVFLTPQKELSVLKDVQQRKLVLTESIKRYLKFEKVSFTEEY